MFEDTYRTRYLKLGQLTRNLAKDVTDVSDHKGFARFAAAPSPVRNSGVPVELSRRLVAGTRNEAQAATAKDPSRDHDVQRTLAQIFQELPRSVLSLRLSTSVAESWRTHGGEWAGRCLKYFRPPCRPAMSSECRAPLRLFLRHVFANRVLENFLASRGTNSRALSNFPHQSICLSRCGDRLMQPASGVEVECRPPSSRPVWIWPIHSIPPQPSHVYRLPHFLR